VGGQRAAHWRFGAELSVSEGSRRLADRPSPPLRIIPPVPPLRVGPLRLLLLVLLVPLHLSLSLRPSCADHADVGLGHRPRLHPSQVLRFVPRPRGGRYYGNCPCTLLRGLFDGDCMCCATTPPLSSAAARPRKGERTVT
jgi:hypothetical protein